MVATEPDDFTAERFSAFSLWDTKATQGEVMQEAIGVSPRRSNFHYQLLIQYVRVSVCAAVAFQRRSPRAIASLAQRFLQSVETRRAPQTEKRGRNNETNTAAT